MMIWEWCSTKHHLPPNETPVLIIHNGEVKIGERRWDYPSHEDTYNAYQYWDNPNNDGQEWADEDVTYWMHIPEMPK